MKNSIEEDIELLQDETSSLGLFFKCKGSEKYKIALEHILSDYKRVLKENKKYKELAEMNLKNAEEFKNNMCEHRCLLKSENKEQKELIEKMKIFLLKENKMWDFLESEE